MRHILHFIAAVFLLLGQSHAQQAPPKSSQAEKSAAPVATSQLVFYPLPEKERAEIRELQYSADQLEIQIQKMSVEIEKHKAEQAEILLRIRGKAYDFATAKHVDLDKYEFDMKEVQFRERKK